jgi:hypothetical protein
MVWRDMADEPTKSLGRPGGPKPFIPPISCEPQKIVDLWLQIVITFVAVAVTGACLTFGYGFGWEFIQSLKQKKRWDYLIKSVFLAVVAGVAIFLTYLAWTATEVTYPCLVKTSPPVVRNSDGSEYSPELYGERRGSDV